MDLFKLISIVIVYYNILNINFFFFIFFKKSKNYPSLSKKILIEKKIYTVNFLLREIFDNFYNQVYTDRFDFINIYFDRRHPDSNWGIKDLQSSALPLGYTALKNCFCIYLYILTL